jgi:putative membrane protein
MLRPVLAALGVAVLALAWLGPLPDLARQSFAAHMTMHMMVVAVAAPLLALSVAGTSDPPVHVRGMILPPLPAAMIEFGIVWVWHAPAFHTTARHHAGVFALEQASFLIAGLLLWTAACGGGTMHRPSGRAAGVAALLFTSMHMTLLGALFALANRPLFVHASDSLATGGGALADQHLGGAIMLLAGGASYLLGGLWLTAGVLRGSAVRGEASS